MQIELLILRNLSKNDEYSRKVLPYIKEEYFQNPHDKCIFSVIKEFWDKHNKKPSKDSILIDISKNGSLNEDAISQIYAKVSELYIETDEVDIDWLIDNTEDFCKERALYNALMESIEITDSKTEEKGKIPTILTDALSVSFDPSIGHDYIYDNEDRFEWYHRKEEKLPFDLTYFNKITEGGLPKKTLNVILAPTGAGKSLFMCHCAARHLLDGHNVLYITLEMSEERVAERIDANLMGVELNKLRELNKSTYDSAITTIKNKTPGKLVIKEYPTTSASSNHFRALLNDLYLKKSFKPTIIYVDYLNICASSRIKANGMVNSYTLIKSIAEELRGLAIEFELPIMTATQTNRSGQNNSDIDLDNTSESFGLPATADLMFALISTEDLEKRGLLMIKQLKNRYNDPGKLRRFVIGVDKPCMKLFDVDESAQKLIQNDTPKGKKSDDDDTPSFDKATKNRTVTENDFSPTSYPF